MFRAKKSIIKDEIKNNCIMKQQVSLKEENLSIRFPYFNFIILLAREPSVAQCTHSSSCRLLAIGGKLLF